MAAYTLSGVTRVSGSPKIPNWFEKKVTYTLAALQLSSNSAGLVLKKDVSNTFSNPFGISSLPETWIMQGELYGVLFLFRGVF